MKIKSTIVTLLILLATLSLSVQTIQNGVLTIPEDKTEIKGQAYYGNKEITKVIIPN